MNKLTASKGRGLDPRVLDAWVRAAFWIIGPVSAAFLTFATRYFINGDAMTYIEMGEGVINGHFRALVNLTYSPMYPVLLGLAQLVLNTNPLNEIQELKSVNFLCFLLAMVACDLLMRLAKKELERLGTATETPMPVWLFRALSYSMFLVAALTLVRLRLINPDMLVFTLVLVITAVLLWIREDPSRYGRYVVLGITAGVGYLSKSFLFIFSPTFFVLAALSAGPARRALPKLVVAIAVMLIIAAPLIGALSSRLGRFTYGELGRHVYALWISGQGEPIFPKVINEKPKTVLYEYDIPSTRPSGFDNCYWQEGFRPRFDLKVHLPIVAENIVDVFIQIPWLLVILFWYALQCRFGPVKAGRFYPPSQVVIMAVVSLAGVGAYCLLRIEPRYIASFLFVGLVALAMSVRFPVHDTRRTRAIVAWSLALVCFFLSLVGYTIIDQSIRSLQLQGPKLSYKEAFMEDLAVKDFLARSGLLPGDRVAIVGSPPVYWARMSGVRILIEIPDTEELLSAKPDDQLAAISVSEKHGIKAVIVQDSRFSETSDQGWVHVPGTRDYFVRPVRPRKLDMKTENRL